MGRKARDLTDQKFGRLRVLERAENSPDGSLRWACICDCGTGTTVFGNCLKQGSTRSCGCLARESSRRLLSENKIAMTHGKTNTPEFGTWTHMRTRVKVHARYADRGMYQPWYDDFMEFYRYLEETIGLHPGGEWTIDRVDNSVGYFPGNVRWLTMDANRRRVRP